MRLSVRANQVLPVPALRALKAALRWGHRGHGDEGRLYSALSLYSAYQPEPTDHTGTPSQQ